MPRNGWYHAPVRRPNPNPRTTKLVTPNELLFVPIQRPRPLTIEKITQHYNNDGLLAVIMLVKAPAPQTTRIAPYFPFKGELHINEKYSVALCLYPNGFMPIGEYSGCISMLLGVYSGGDESLFAKFETCILARDGAKTFRRISKDFLLFPSDLFLKVRNIGCSSKYYVDWDRYAHNSKLHVEVKVTIDTKRKPRLNIIEYEPKSTVQRIKDKIYDPEFGNLAFTVGGVKMFAHREILMRNDRVFRELFRTAVLKCGIYNLPDTYPQAFAKRIMSCYLQERIICRQCFLNPEKCICYAGMVFCRRQSN